MKAFSVVFRDKLTDKLYSGIVDKEELIRLVNNEAIKICVTTELEVKR